jgi:hypothetical protein
MLTISKTHNLQQLNDEIEAAINEGHLPSLNPISGVSPATGQTVNRSVYSLSGDGTTLTLTVLEGELSEADDVTLQGIINNHVPV